MKKIICKVEYDTEASQLIEKRTFGQFGDPAGYEETLYVTEGGKYFLYVNGGEESIHAKEDIKRVSAAKAEEWKAEHNLADMCRSSWNWQQKNPDGYKAK